MSPETLQIVERVDVVEGVSVIGLRQTETPRPAALVKEALHHLGHEDLAVGVDVRVEEVQELFAEGISNLEKVGIP